MSQPPDFNSLINECSFEATRSSGKGGQNVNKLSTKVILLFDVNSSLILSDTQKAIIIQSLQSRISKEGIFRITSDRERSQLANRKTVIDKFIRLLEKAFMQIEERISTKPTERSKIRRIEAKKNVSEKKTERSQRFDGEMDQ